MDTEKLSTRPCLGCGRPVMWFATAKGWRMPVDPEPTANGNVLIRGGVVVVLKKGQAPDPGENRYTSHTLTCPKAKKFRR